MTRDRILDKAFHQASLDGLDGLSIGGLAAELGLSKSGLFAHFGSKEELQLQVLKASVERFVTIVTQPAMAAPRGEPRLRAFFENWLAWGNDSGRPGGCPLVAAAIELDDRPGPLRDYLVSAQREWLACLAKGARLTIEQGHFRAGVDPEQFAFEFYSLALGYHHARRLLHDAGAERRVRAAFERLLQSSHP